MAVSQRVAIVTGGSRGIGRQIVKRLATAGYAVALNYATSKVEAEQAVAEVIAAGGNAVAVQADVADEFAVADLFDTTERTYGGIDVVVHSAGIAVHSPVAELDLADLDRVHRTNVRGTFVVDQQAARRVRPGGAIINISSTTPRLSLPGYAAYAASKAAMDSITLILARELRGRDITVNAVAPGATATALFLEGKDEQMIARMAAMSPMNRLGDPTETADVVAFLAGPARWINGQVLYVNGGAA
ncbi:3-oxoacyl-[acyl-carrier-protein] reductase FabG [Micromonospora sp. MW-13]|uniref:SDR family oxidoreductase n=1 Tax=unclassified Micromonospora TaxID=2617518 RepID=UPI000E43E9BD|nr:MULTISPECIES: SDR family oxidoreductase [unclassified Micromonospora]MCX4472637.1 SDR family oxidoreductase [Micromonospora sp. NBC_01655]RGC69327.1 3-oxoacyl-[acyl-carrier-protein] reductase FabG [Micromonospora sp. MW-13]